MTGFFRSYGMVTAFKGTSALDARWLLVYVPMVTVTMMGALDGLFGAGDVGSLLSRAVLIELSMALYELLDI